MSIKEKLQSTHRILDLYTYELNLFNRINNSKIIPNTRKAKYVSSYLKILIWDISTSNRINLNSSFNVQSCRGRKYGETLNRSRSMHTTDRGRIILKALMYRIINTVVI